MLFLLALLIVLRVLLLLTSFLLWWCLQLVLLIYELMATWALALMMFLLWETYMYTMNLTSLLLWAWLQFYSLLCFMALLLRDLLDPNLHSHQILRLLPQVLVAPVENVLSPALQAKCGVSCGPREGATEVASADTLTTSTVSRRMRNNGERTTTRPSRHG